MVENKELFGLSYFLEDSKYYCNDNKKVPGKMKDEYGETAIWIFVGTKSKIYSILDVNKYEKSVYKAHNSNIGFDEFIDVYSNENVFRNITKGIKSFGHRMHTYETNKISLSVFDHKWYIKDDRINTLSYGHKDIPKLNKVVISYYDWY